MSLSTNSNSFKDPTIPTFSCPEPIPSSSLLAHNTNGSISKISSATSGGASILDSLPITKNRMLESFNFSMPASSMALPQQLREKINDVAVHQHLTPSNKLEATPLSDISPQAIRPQTIAEKYGSKLSSLYGNKKEIITDILIKDNQNLNKAESTFSLGQVKLNENHHLLKQSCEQLIRESEHLFVDEEAFKILLDEFMKKNPDVESIIDYKTINIPTFNLDGKGYHNIGHAKEMFYDTYEKLFHKDLPSSTCTAGATMAFFHDLVQGMDMGFPTLGINEEVTAKFLNFIIDKNMTEKLKEPLKDLSNATITGGTFLLKVQTPEGDKNFTVSELMDKDLQSTSETMDILKTIRQTLAFNDISRTTDKPTPSLRKNNEMMSQISEIKTEANNNFSQKIAKSTIATNIFNAVGKNLTSRLFQSIRMLTEIPVAIKDKRILLPNKNEVIRELENPHSNLADDHPISLLLDKMKRDTTWTNGTSCEAAFAGQSNHTDYVAMLTNHAQKITSAKVNDIKDLIIVALTNGQDGKGFPNPSELFDNN